MNQYPRTAKTRIDLTTRVLLLAIISLLFALSFRLLTRNATNSTDYNGNEEGAFIMQQKPKISNNSTCYKSACRLPNSQNWSN
jgi:high-affinity Fe2+/Pb2+ permease